MPTIKIKHNAKRKSKKQNSKHIYIKFEEQYERARNKGEFKKTSIIEKNTHPNDKIKDDYYTYINHNWIDSISKKLTETPKFYVRIDTVRITQEKVYYELLDIVKQYIKENNNKLSHSLKNVYDSMYKLDEKSGELYFEEYNAYVKKQMDSGSIYDMLADQNRNELISTGTPIAWYVYIDDKNSKIYKSIVTSPILTLYDLSLYSTDNKDDDETLKYKRAIKRKYNIYVESMFNLCLGANHKHNVSDIWDCECVMAKAMDYGISMTDEYEYNLISKKESHDKFGLDWQAFAKKLGYTNVPSSFVCTNKTYLKRMMPILIKEWNTPKWHTYFLYNCFKQAIRFHKSGKQIHYNFHGKFIRGAQSPYPADIYPIFGLSMCFNTFLTNEYNARHNNVDVVNYVEDIAGDLLIVFKRIIKRNKWLSKPTINKALLKLDKIKLLVGSPKLLREDPMLTYDNKCAFKNMVKISNWRINKYIELDGNSTDIDIPSIDWNTLSLTGKQSYNVNAFNMQNENTIYIPFAYLQEPFVDLKNQGIEYNLANIGYTISHEMSHCLDDLGSQYDEKGNLANWWTPNDKRGFRKRMGDIIKQYETCADSDGINMDATLSIGENIADISGLFICEEYLHDFHIKNKYIAQMKTLSFETFFVYIAFQSRQKIQAASIKAQLKIDPHPMEKYRVNCPLSRLKSFKSIYNIKKGDKMYWHNDESFW